MMPCFVFIVIFFNGYGTEARSPSPAPLRGFPLPVGEGSEYPHFLLEDGARRPSSYYDLQCSYS